ncbi:MAG: hypothetical protein GY943_30970, partial [Chloroflexi bacterium]|nr:hypothetical protein [Chloroflexota bacterium]
MNRYWQIACLSLFFFLVGCKTTSTNESGSPVSATEFLIVIENTSVATAQDGSGEEDESSYLPLVQADETDTPDTAKYVVQIDTNRNVHPISPMIYGLSGLTPEHTSQMRPTFVSWGGNPSTRYNWRLGNAWNSGSDWFYRNGNYGYTGPSASDDFVMNANAEHIAV